jgi:hypothetical protein
MSRSAKITAFFGDGDHDFALRIGECEELQELLDCGLAESLQRVEAVRVNDIRQVLRLGLIGGGMSKEDAFRLVTRHLTPGDLGACAVLAARVVGAAIVGSPEELLGELKGERTDGPRSP